MGEVHARARMAAIAFAIALVAGLLTATATAFAAEGADQLAAGGLAAQDVSVQASDGLKPGQWGYQNDWGYEVLANGNARIEYYGGSSQTVKFPSAIAGRKVTELDCSLGGRVIKKIVIPATVKKIYGLNAKLDKDDEYYNPYRSCGTYSYNDKTGEYTLKGSLTSIVVAKKNKKFKSVKGVLFNKKGTKLYAYPNAKTGKYKIPSKVKSIASYAFSYSRAKKITISGSVKTVGGYAFYMTYAKSIAIKNGVKTIGPCAFASMRNVKSMKFPSSVKTVSHHALAYSEKLSRIKLNTGLKTVGVQAFEGTAIKSITIPATVKKIKLIESYKRYGTKYTVLGHPFVYCPKLTSIKVAKGNKKYVSVKGVLFNKKKTALLAYPANKKGSKYKVPKKVKSIGSYAFCSNKKLLTVLLPSKLKKICKCAFYGNNMTSITIPASVASIGEDAFAWGDRLVVTNKSKVSNTSDAFFGVKEVK